ncbi:Arginase family enzyme [Halanaeroarchaeum sp. HSR-CO]|uniref:agmatinase family protein n=1 Tax=Halanaeroarchaeum sp. HSR-CO TaxID=2866382 RepID=UPI00217EDFFF|nr:agmatinase family protein [Halanaeroarchaeum sp. HSR-CO]UWG48081.1 Arginase family enzyme [Halanaeroarchaeum sp. HSR-CO]
MSDPRDRATAFRESTAGSDVELAYAGLDTFLKGEARAIDDVDDVDAAVFGVPYDGAASNRPGARYGPGAIRKASHWWAYLSQYKGELTDMRNGDQIDFGQFSVADVGDVPVFPMDHEKTGESITAHAATVAAQTFPIMLGGDHYCSFPAFRGFAEGTDFDRIGLVQIDAHTDTVAESPVFGTDFHGSSTARIADLPNVDYDSVSQVGIRGYESPDFFEFADESGLNLFPMSEVERRGMGAVIVDAIEAAAAGTDAVYVTFDIDSVDPGFAPGTGTPAPAGLSSQQALEAMSVLGEHDAVGAIDMMEVAPRYDSTEGTERLAAFLLVKFLERRFAR